MHENPLKVSFLIEDLPTRGPLEPLMYAGTVVFVLGPAGTGKSTLCGILQEHCHATKRPCTLINLDPACTYLPYAPDKDIREVLGVQDVMQELDLGPNGALVQCLEELLSEEGIEWLIEDFEGCEEPKFLIIDLPGQIEIYTHYDIVPRLVCLFQDRLGFTALSCYLMESRFVLDAASFMGALLNATSAMLNLACSHLNILTKMDLIPEESKIEEWLEEGETDTILNGLADNKLNRALRQLLDEWGMVSLYPLNIKKEDSIGDLLLRIDQITGFYEHLETKEQEEEQEDEA